MEVGEVARMLVAGTRLKLRGCGRGGPGLPSSRLNYGPVPRVAVRPIDMEDVGRGEQATVRLAGALTGLHRSHGTRRRDRAGAT